MNTVQRVPKSTGARDFTARAANSATPMPSDFAKVSMKEPQPAEQASFSVMPPITPSFTKKHFMS